jgi:hypothetical protein
VGGPFSSYHEERGFQNAWAWKKDEREYQSKGSLAVVLYCSLSLSLSLSHKLRATTFVGSANMQQPLESELTHIHFPLSCLIGVGFWVSLPHFLSL